MCTCENCKHHEWYHKFKNPIASAAKHWCKKCNEEIEYNYKTGFQKIPKECWFNHYYQLSEEYEERESAKYKE